MKKQVYAWIISAIIAGGSCGYWLARRGYHIMQQFPDGSVRSVMILESREDCEHYRMLYGSRINYDELRRTGTTLIEWAEYDNSDIVKDSKTWCEARR